MVNKKRLDICNAVRELTKASGKATREAMDEMKRIMKFVLDTKDIGLKFEPKLIEDINGIQWELVAYSDSDWAGDKDNRKSVSGWMIYLLNCPISGKSRQQGVVSLSSAEAEWMALSETIKELLFIIQVLEEVGVNVIKPVKVNVDNQAAIFMAKNTTATKRTKHIDVRANFVYEHVNEETGEIEVVFVRTEENKADIFTKNVSKELMDKHTEYLGRKEDMS